MKQIKPPPHPLMTIRIDSDSAKSFLESSALQAMSTALTDPLEAAETVGSEKLARALERISIACYRYDQGRRYHLPGDKVDIDWYQRLRTVTAEFSELIDEGSLRTVNRLLIAVAEEAGHRSENPTSKRDDQTDDDQKARLSRQLDRGLAILNQQMKLLFWWESASKRAGEALPARSGAPPTTTPLLERSLIHELVDIWCGFHNKDYVAPKSPISPTLHTVRPNQRGARFVAVVLDRAGFDFSRFDIVDLGTMVRKERIEERERHSDDPHYAATRTLREAGNLLRKRSLTRKVIDPVEKPQEAKGPSANDITSPELDEPSSGMNSGC